MVDKTQEELLTPTLTHPHPLLPHPPLIPASYKIAKWSDVNPV